MIDTNAILAAYLKTSGTGLYTLVSTRVYVGLLPPGFTNSTKAILITAVGGAPDAYVADAEVRFAVKCFGGSASMGDAHDVYRALNDRLHNIENQSATGGVIASALEDTGGQDLIDPETGWPFVLCYYTVLFHA